MSTAKVLLFSPLDNETVVLVTGHAPPQFQVQTYPHTTPDKEKIKLVRDADFILLFVAPLSDGALQAAKKVRLIQLLGSGTS